ncbi:glutathione S-transferase family protein [Sphingomonas sp. Y38-1Y]|uniref:glutathione S-transferase family protein n=1 Tax=Sphingomonas sp. Y38-1Y TaxID=3078265 RepID=UPI0028ECC7A2|nr:glutathione S-transferase family protein [Sphingomonas sp. Y38-1Y]
MIALYGHPFAAFAWKALIALHERGVPFEFRQVDQPEHGARIAELSPTGQFPVIVDGDRTVVGSNAVIDYLDGIGDMPPLIPADRLAAIEARELADLFDDYIAVPMQRIVADALLPDAERSPSEVARQRERLRRAYAWFERRLAGRDWATGERFTIADVAAAPALFYADWAEPLGDSLPVLTAYRARLLARPSIARVVDDARPFRRYFPLGAPHRD